MVSQLGLEFNVQRSLPSLYQILADVSIVGNKGDTGRLGRRKKTQETARRPQGDAGRCREMQGDAGRRRETQGDAGRRRELSSKT